MLALHLSGGLARHPSGGPDPIQLSSRFKEQDLILSQGSASREIHLHYDARKTAEVKTDFSP